MPTIIGTVNNKGQPIEPANGQEFTSQNTGVGEYTVQFKEGVFENTPIVVATPVTKEHYTCAISTWGTNAKGFNAVVSNMSAEYINFGFSFIAQSPE